LLGPTSGTKGAPASPPLDKSPSHERPLLRDFMGLNVHTVQFKPDLYAPVCRRLRDYHPMRWDVEENPAKPTLLPMAANGVDWASLYGLWNKAGFDVDACVLFDDLTPDKWKDPSAEARAYGEAFARALGPSAKSPRVTSVEIGNEPSKYSEAQYRAIFEGMARGLRAGDAKLKIATCAVMTGKTDEWSKPMSAVAGLEDLYDVLNVHSYAFKELWPTWRRSFPEDESIRFLKSIDEVLKWRDAHAPGKEVWLTEFGYDSASKPPPADGPWSKWVGVSGEEQAQYIVRSYLTLSATDLDRAYLYFFNDKDEPQLHGASGITRNFKPKPSFYAMAHLYKTLGDYRFARAMARKEGDLFCFEYVQADHPKERIYVAWSPTADAKPSQKTLPIDPKTSPYRAEIMPTSQSAPAKPTYKPAPGGVESEVSATSLFLWTH
ncbi:MAG: hypothetical protein JWN51_944, partial [Phycisphaerales bacterium]|nr:hypothetical protein [Phycisphaerales bacterium]